MGVVNPAPFTLKFNLMSFRKIIIIRHGKYDEDTDRMDSRGQRQMERLVPKIKEYMAGEENVLFLSSSAPRAEDCAKIISAALDISYEATEYLWSDNRHYQDNGRAIDFIKQKAGEKDGATAVIIITHLEYAHNFGKFIMEDSGKGFPVRSNLEKGEMLFIDFQKETSEFIPN